VTSASSGESSGFGAEAQRQVGTGTDQCLLRFSKSRAEMITLRHGSTEVNAPRESRRANSPELVVLVARALEP